MPGHAQHAVVGIRGECDQRSAHDPALADAHSTGPGCSGKSETSIADTSSVPLSSWNAGIGSEAVGVDHRPLEHHEVDETLLHPVDGLVEVRHVLSDWMIVTISAVEKPSQLAPHQTLPACADTFSGPADVTCL